AQEVAILDHRAPTSTGGRLARGAADGRSGADRVLRPVVWRQDGDARAGPGGQLLPVDLLGRLQRMDLEERLDPLPRQLYGPGRVRDLRVRPGQHLQLRGDGGSDRSAAVH